MKIREIKHGQTIQLLQDINIPDSTEIIIEVPTTQLMSDEER